MWCLWLPLPKKWYVHENWLDNIIPIVLGQEGNNAHINPTFLFMYIVIDCY
jgi:hypothetical protein